MSENESSIRDYVKPFRADGSIHFSIALQDGTRQAWKVPDTVSNWHFAWWIYACDRPPKTPTGCGRGDPSHMERPPGTKQGDPT